MKTGSAKPSTTIPTNTTLSRGDAAQSASPSAKQNRLAEIVLASPSRLTIGRRRQASGTAPTPWTEITTPTQLAGLSNASTIENTADSMKPITRSATPIAISVCSRTGSRRM